MDTQSNQQASNMAIDETNAIFQDYLISWICLLIFANPECVYDVKGSLIFYEHIVWKLRTKPSPKTIAINCS